MEQRLLNCDSIIPFGERLQEAIDTGLVKSGNILYIGVITAPIAGAGDLVYGIKFVKTLMDRYENLPLGVCFLVPDAKPYYLTMTQDRLKNYNPVTNPPSPDKFGKLNIFVTHRERNIDVLRKDLIPIEILFIAPGTNQNHFNLNSPYLDPDAVYLMSEYNTSDKLRQNAAVRLSEVTINAGVYDPDDCVVLSSYNTCPAGVFITEDKDYPKLVIGQHGNGKAEHYFIPTSANGQMRPYTVSYVYTDENNILNMYRGGEDIPTEKISQLLLDKDLGHKDPSSCALRSTTPNGRAWRQSMMVMAKCFYTFLENIGQYRKDNGIVDPILVYTRGAFLTDFRKFIVLENRQRDFIGKLWKWLDGPKSPFEFAIYPNLPVNEFLGFCQHAVPISFLSGDNSVMEFISVNRNPILKIVYQSFYWKRALAKALGVKLEGNRLDTCGMATIDRGKFLRNVGNNFGITGMAQVESLLARQLTNGDLPCKNNDHRTISTRLLDSNHFVYNVSTKDGVVLNFSLADNPFNTDLITGGYKKLRGSARDVLLAAWAKKSQENLFVKFIDSKVTFDHCTEFEINLNNEELKLKSIWVNNGALRVNEVPDFINAIIANNYLNQVIKEKLRMKDMLIYTYATVISNGHGKNCGGKRASEMFGNKDTGVFILQEFIPHTTTFGDMFKLGKEGPMLIYKLLAQLYDVLWTLQDKFKLVHNDLHGSNILVEHLAEPQKYKINNTTFTCQYSVRVIDFDHAAVNIQNSRVRVVSKSGWKYKCKEFRNYYDFAYLLADMYTMLDRQEPSDGNRNSYINLTGKCLAALFNVHPTHIGIQSVLSQNRADAWIPPKDYEGSNFGALGKFLEDQIPDDNAPMLLLPSE
jgi:hypothetical protein